MSDKTSGGRVIALGFFDGVHVGHQRLLEKTVQAASRLGVSSCALTFDIHPEALITGSAIPLLTTANDRADIMRKMYGIDEVIFAHFDDSMMHLSWSEFVSSMLKDRFEAVHLVAGHDFHFGFTGEGNPQRLVQYCSELGLGCDIISRVDIDSITVSSTYIRKLVAQGEMERAELFLGHPHIITGRVTHGERLGTLIEAPTSNIEMNPALQTPALGVYITVTCLDDERYQSVTNIGTRPTVNGQELRVETHLLDFSDDLYGRQITIEFMKMLRPEQKFQGLAELSAQIGRDIQEAREYFRSSPYRIRSVG